MSRPSRSHIIIVIVEAFTILHCHCRVLHDPTLSLSRLSRSYIVIIEAFTILHCHCRGLHDPTLSLSRPSRSHILSLSRPSRSYIDTVKAFTIPHIVIVEAFTILHCHCRGLHDLTYCHCRGLHDPTLLLSRSSRSYIVIVEAFTIPLYGHEVLKPLGHRHYRISVSQQKGTTPCSDCTRPSRFYNSGISLLVLSAYCIAQRVSGFTTMVRRPALYA